MNGREKLVFLPGHMCDERLFAPQIECFRDDYDIAVANFHQGTSFSDYAAHVLELAHGEPINLCGLSMGGMIAGDFAALHPGLVRRLALLATTLRPETAHRAETRRQRIERAASSGLRAIAQEELVPSYLSRSNSGREDLREALVDMAVDAGLDVFARQSAAMTGRGDRRAELASLAAPTLILCGDEDRLFPVEVHREIAGIFGSGVMQVLGSTGHIITLEAPVAVNHALRVWLDRPAG